MSPAPPQLTNIRAIIDMEQQVRDRRSWVARLTDGVTALAGSPVFVFAHLIWFVAWIGSNTGGSATFDRYPFNLLTLLVSLEAIMLTGFVLMSQSRMTQQADRRAHLDLQINLLAEQELTAILRVQCLLAERAGLDVSKLVPRLEHLRSHTDVEQLAATLEAELESGDHSGGDR
jgi:uncharacterized membrane protein